MVSEYTNYLLQRFNDYEVPITMSAEEVRNYLIEFEKEYKTAEEEKGEEETPEEFKRRVEAHQKPEVKNLPIKSLEEFAEEGEKPSPDLAIEERCDNCKFEDENDDDYPCDDCREYQYFQLKEEKGEEKLKIVAWTNEEGLKRMKAAEEKGEEEKPSEIEKTLNKIVEKSATKKEVEGLREDVKKCFERILDAFDYNSKDIFNIIDVLKEDKEEILNILNKEE